MGQEVWLAVWLFLWCVELESHYVVIQQLKSWVPERERGREREGEGEKEGERREGDGERERESKP